MNYGKNSIKKQRKQLSNKKARAQKKFILSFVRAIIVCILIVIAIGIGGFAVYATELIKETPDISAVDISPNGFSTTILDKDGKEIENLASAGANREYVTLKQIPEDLQHAFVAIEDSRFYEHNGIDTRGIIRAAVIGAGELAHGKRPSQGASTITQQLLKNNVFTTWTSENTLEDSLKRKIQEQYLAVQLEKKVTKDEILENYLNTINLGQNTLGVQAASERYFNKSVSELNLSEAAVIAGITQNPSRFNPITNPEENEKRRKKVLGDMLDQGYITEKQYKKAMKDDVYSRIQVVNNEIKSDFTSYFVDALTDQVVHDLMEKKGYSESEAFQKLYSGGLTVYSTQDGKMQDILDEEINNTENYGFEPKVSFSYRLTITKKDGSYENYSEQTMLSYYQAKTGNKGYSINYDSKEEAQAAIDAYKEEIMEPGDTISESGESVVFTLQPQVAMTLIDQSTGNVVAITGGRGDKTASKTLNRATGIKRQPGSTFKILAAFAPALDAGGMSLATVQDDAPTNYANGRPVNNYDHSYRGFTSIRQAIISSINIVTVKTLTEIGTGLGYEYVQDFGITTLDSSDNTQSLALGGLTYGVYNVELCGAYATIANGGQYNRPVFYTRVLDYNGDILLDNTYDEPRTVLKPTTAWLLTSAMKDVMTSGTGVRANITGMTVAGKSGTTTKDRDTVFAGFSPYYTCTIWGGYDDNTPQSITSYSKNIWRAVMQRVHEGLEDKDFEMPEGIVQKTVCSKSGLLPIEGVCDHDPRGSMLKTEYFDAENVPSETCNHHTSATICKTSFMLAGEYCPDTSTGVYIVGATPGSPEEGYAVSGNATEVCNIHTKDYVKKQEEKKKKKEEAKKAREEEEEEELDEEDEWIEDEDYDWDYSEDETEEETIE